MSMLKIALRLFCLVVSSAALAQTPDTSLPASAQRILDQAGIPASAVSIVALSANTNKAVLSVNPEAGFSPASTMKLLTSLVALEELGPAFRWKTQLLTDSPVRKDVLNGDLYLRGGGDPDLNWEKFSVMLRALRNQGIRKIRGNLILDRSYFQPSRPDLGAPAFDEFPDAYYNVVPDPLLINSNLSSIGIESTGQKIEAHLLTPLDKISFSNHLHFNDKSCAEWESEWKIPQISIQRRNQIDILLRGGFPRYCKITAHLNLLDRNQYIAHLFRRLWQEMGGSWQGQVQDGTAPEDAIVLYEHQSATLAETLRTVNKQSDNGMARMLYLTLGAESPQKTEDHLQAASLRIRRWLQQHQINDSGLVLENGSGLSRTEKISASQMAAVLQAGMRSNWNAEFLSSLPIAALDGTMRKRLKGSAAEQRARIKTGSLRDTAAIAGYVRDNQDQSWVIVAMINSEFASKARPALDEILNWIAAGRP
ncbi:D-alanyl-D-alanine carboxypeptidase/D-alanyl-D-alanine-endopeptidase [Undibacterium oligocarboniphilum]|uniref:D-alanyl-D-alanine carboxypeptidase/D-alanyl-D-alanine-endopeptidase n=2 Tax=Undibacterium oligocarboniphilum TaxID=666702 RepID=A0A850QCP1_9BURK|nr:D-alanyl-D-alanine carboxypeptidase/D-alanyl-D-alanine-endopeptidase [Undibacterium oligocarboniphilum]NVO77341.1 D-alanyl-D-alanine carboxypeptidase/D-alanyl-D-alanine-endopeptidase [Undibacterium oligocarboniphilum]